MWRAACTGARAAQRRARQPWGICLAAQRFRCIHCRKRPYYLTWWYSCEPWLKLKRATLMPARSSSSQTSTLRDMGPSVQTTCDQD